MIIDLIGNTVEKIQTDSGVPYYSYNTWVEEANRLTQINIMGGSTDLKFPLVFLRLPIKEDFEESEQTFEADLYIYIIGRTESIYKSEYRHENEMPALREIETELLSKLNMNNVKFTDYSREEVMHAELKELNQAMNFIELIIPSRYNINCLT